MCEIDGESWETEKLYDMGASVFPTSLGSDPMVGAFSVSICIHMPRSLLSFIQT